MILIEEIAFEKLLSRWIFQMNFIFFYCIGVFPLLIVNMILVKVFSIGVRHVGCSHSAILESGPVEIVEPWVVLHLFITFKAESS